MDEIEMVASLRTDPAPSPDTVAHHKSQLQVAIAASSNGAAVQRATPPIPTPGRDRDKDRGETVISLTLGRPVEPGPRRSRRGRILAAAAVVAVAGGVATVLAADDGPDFESANTQAVPTCGGDLPFVFPAPVGFDGPVDGPLPDEALALEQPLARHVVRHWTSPTGGIELRWPSQDLLGDDAAGDPPADPDTSTTTLPEVALAEEGTVFLTDELPDGADIGFHQLAVGAGGAEVVPNPAGFSGQVSSPLLGDGECGTIRLTVTADSPDAASALFTESRYSLLAILAQARFRACAEALVHPNRSGGNRVPSGCAITSRDGVIRG